MLLHLTLDFRKRRFRAGQDVGAGSGRMHGSSRKRQIQRVTELMFVRIFFERSMEQDRIRGVVLQEPS